MNYILRDVHFLDYIVYCLNYGLRVPFCCQ